MILLDTDAVSEPIRRHPDSRVLDWLDARVIETPYLSTVSLGELLSGVENLSVGRRRTALAAALERQIADLFDDRIISFDTAAAKAYAKAVARARSQGHTSSIANGQIAGIATSRDLRVASRDETPFRAAGLTVINPWTAES
jgi:predicted nucleic acid-binding protein